MSSSNVNIKLFVEIVQLMGLKGYDITPFNFLIQNEAMNHYYTERGKLDKVQEIDEKKLLQFIFNYRMTNFGVSNDLFPGEKMQYSMVFDHCYNGLRTLVCIGNEMNESTSKASSIEMTDKLKAVTLYRTGGQDANFLSSKNRVSGIFIINKSISSASKTFLNELKSIQIIEDTDIFNRSHDNCLQSHIEEVNKLDADKMLSEIGISKSNIPSTSREIDAQTRLRNFEPGTMLKFTRSQISSEEPNGGLFIRNVRS